MPLLIAHTTLLESHVAAHMYYSDKNVFLIPPLQMAHFIAHSLQLDLEGTLIQTQVAVINYMHRKMGYSNLTDNFISLAY